MPYSQGFIQNISHVNVDDNMATLVYTASWRLDDAKQHAIVSSTSDQDSELRYYLVSQAN